MKLKNPIGTTAAADIWDISPQLLLYYIKKGLTPKPEKIGRYYFFEKAEIEKAKKPSLERGGDRKSK